jgi:hypothetical protein
METSGEETSGDTHNSENPHMLLAFYLTCFASFVS